MSNLAIGGDILKTMFASFSMLFLLCLGSFFYYCQNSFHIQEIQRTHYIFCIQFNKLKIEEILQCIMSLYLGVVLLHCIWVDIDLTPFVIFLFFLFYFFVGRLPSVLLTVSLLCLFPIDISYCVGNRGVSRRGSGDCEVWENNDDYCISNMGIYKRKI